MESTRTDYPDKVKWTNKQGQLHRENGPAREYTNGNKSWYLNGKLHRVDGPAIEWLDGYKSWYLNGMSYTEQEYNEELLKIRLQRLMEL